VSRNDRRSGWRAAIAVALLIGILSACTLQKQYGVPTHTVPVKGNCDTSRIDEVGAALPLSGPERALGQQYLTGIKLAVFHANDTRGILSKHVCLELLYKNIDDNIHIGDRAVLDLVNSEIVTFLVAPFQSSVIKFTGSDLGQSGVPNTTFSSLNQTRNRNNYPMTFPTQPDSSVQATVLASYARSQHWSTVAVAALSDPAGEQGLTEFKGDFTHDGGTVTGTVMIPRVGTLKASSLGVLQAGNPQALVVIGDTLQVGQALIARQQLNWSIPTLTTWVAADQAVVSQLAAAGKKGVFVLVPKAVVLPTNAKGPSDPSMVSFVKQLKKYLQVSSFSGSIIPYAEAYDGTLMLASAANSINSVSPANIQTYLENANYQGLLASYNYTSSRHTGVSPKQLTVAPLDTLSNGFFHYTPVKR
jgi:ABC-type branched-subunit amino acid transport system substrate-binding protein